MQSSALAFDHTSHALTPAATTGLPPATPVDACQPLSFMVFERAGDALGQARTAASWRHFVGGLRRVLAQSSAPAKTELPAIGPFTLSPGERRSDVAVDAVTLLAVDVDALPAAELPALLDRLRPYAAVAHTSPSDRGDTAGVRKLRIYALPSRPITAAECRATRLGFAAQLGITCDTSTLNPSRVFFAGKLEGAPAREVWAFDGVPVDVDALLAAAPAESGYQASTRAAQCDHAAASGDASELAASCILGRALLARKSVIGVRQLDRGSAVIIRCPNAAHHDRHGARNTDETAVYLPPKHPGGLGAISCMRTACAGITDWLPFFEDHELTDAGLILARVAHVYTDNVDQRGRRRLCAELAGSDLSVRYLRCSEGTPAWCALHNAANATEPAALEGKWIGVTRDADGRVDRIYTVAAA